MNANAMLLGFPRFPYHLKLKILATLILWYTLEQNNRFYWDDFVHLRVLMTLDFIGLVLFAFVVLLLVTAKPRTHKSKLYGTKPLTEIQQIAYWRLVEACGTDKVILAQVAFSSFIRMKGGDRKGRTTNLGRTGQKAADFVICNKDFSIFAIVEIDDEKQDKRNDEARGRITRAAGLRTVRISAREIPTAIELRRSLGL